MRNLCVLSCCLDKRNESEDVTLGSGEQNEHFHTFLSFIKQTIDQLRLVAALVNIFTMLLLLLLLFFTFFQCCQYDGSESELVERRQLELIMCGCLGCFLLKKVYLRK